jgi:alkanesulfonate monooxygenase SsuD/methylene tetrahydromethanopterin reductase-like flavin-dependent oxidoreductase (luciferase family)
MARGFGVAGALDHEVAGHLAAEAERNGFATFWANDTPSGDGLALLASAARATSAIRLAVGVIPVDRKPASQIIEQVRRLGLPGDRLTIGIGAGEMKSGSLQAVASAAHQLKQSLSARILVGSLGPKMTALGGTAADGALLNWLTADEAANASQLVRDAASGAGLPSPQVAAYIRVALGDRAFEKLSREAARYESYPQYKRHFERMGVPAIETAIFGEEPETLQLRITAYEDEVDEAVVRAISADETFDGYLALLRATSPK